MLAVVFVATALWSGLGAGVRATAGGRVTADEPQYLLSAISLAEDGDLDIADELDAQRWRAFHRAPLPTQTEPRADGTTLSPHDPLLPALLAPGVAVVSAVAPDWQYAELAGARLVMALLAGALAGALAWTAVARLGVSVRTALVTVGGFAAVAPFAAYGSQLYPELPAALAVAGAAAALLPTRPEARWTPPAVPTWTGTAIWVGAVVALPWLGVKYAGVAAAIALIGLVSDRRHRRAALVVLALAGVAYLVFHQRLYGGWTVYAAGDHFTAGELTVVGQHPDHVGRTVRLLGLLVDRHFGLVAWAPGWLLGVPALAWVARRGGRTAVVLLVPLAAGWATATWVALTMHGWWWPGRQVVVVLPLVVLAVAAFVDDRFVKSPLAGRRWLAATVVAGLFGAVAWLWTVAESTFGQFRLIVDLDRSAGWPRPWSLLLPDQRATGTAVVAGDVVWVLVLVGLAVLGWRLASGGDPGRPDAGRSSAAGDQDALAGERTDADRVPVDLHRGGAVGR